MAEIRTKLITTGIYVAALAATPFIKKAATGFADKESWQWWDKVTPTAVKLTEVKNESPDNHL